jgi:dihydrofolate reductase
VYHVTIRDTTPVLGLLVAQTFMVPGLLDEYRLVVNPIRLGGGTALFPSDGSDVPLDLTTMRRFASGAVLLCYRPRTRANMA